MTQAQRGVSCYTKEFGTRGGFRVRSNGQYLITEQFGKQPKVLRSKHYPFILPGLGEPGQHCMKSKLHSICPTGDGLGYINMKCKRIECPNCYKNWVYERVFDIAVKTEAYKMVTGDEPAHIVFSDSPENFIGVDWEIYESFFKRGYRHVTAIGGDGGVRIFHGYRVKPEIKFLLKKQGYGGQRNGFWKGVREDALHLGDYRKYVGLSPHAHCIVFPSWLKEHSDKHFFLKKIGSLPTLDDVIRLCFYLISHCGVLTEDEDFDNHPVQYFGELHRWKPENFLSVDELVALRNRVADKLGCDFVDGELKFRRDNDEPKKCKCGTCTDDFIPIHEFAIYSQVHAGYVDAVIGSMQNSAFWWSVIHTYNEKLNDPALDDADRHIFLADLDVPTDIDAIDLSSGGCRKK